MVKCMRFASKTQQQSALTHTLACIHTKTHINKRKLEMFPIKQMSENNLQKQEFTNTAEERIGEERSGGKQSKEEKKGGRKG